MKRKRKIVSITIEYQDKHMKGKVRTYSSKDDIIPNKSYSVLSVVNSKGI